MVQLTLVCPQGSVIEERWMGGLMDIWIDGWINGWINICIDGCMDGCFLQLCVVQLTLVCSQGSAIEENVDK